MYISNLPIIDATIPKQLFSLFGYISKPCSNFLLNHQKYQIALLIEDRPIFQVRDSHGVYYSITEFIVEDIDLTFQKACLDQGFAADSGALVYAYLQERFKKASPYQIHVEKYQGQYVIRFGAYGLKGGAPFECLNNKKGAIVLSMMQVGLGIYLQTRGGLGSFCGSVLISLGLSTGLYAHQKEEQDYTREEYVHQMYQSFLSSLLFGSASKIVTWVGSTHFFSLTRFALISRLPKPMKQIGARVVISISETALSTTALKLTKRGKIDLYDITNIMHKIALEGLGTVVSSALDVVTLPYRDLAVDTLTAKGYEKLIEKSLNTPTAAKIFMSSNMACKKFLQGGMSLALRSIISNHNKKPITLRTRVLQASLVGGVCGVSGFIERWQAIGDIAITLGNLTADHMRAQTKKYMDLAVPLLKDMKQWEADFDIWNTSEKGTLASIAKKKELDSRLDILGQRKEEVSREKDVRLNVIAELGSTFKPKVEGYLEDHRLLLETHPPRIYRMENEVLGSFFESDPSEKELIPHIVLVHALTPGLSRLRQDGFDDARATDPTYIDEGVLKVGVTPDAVTGHHLRSTVLEEHSDVDFDVRPQTLDDRPHQHWAWNQLVQPHSEGNWEDARIALLEPLQTFESSMHYRPLGIAPYDSMTIGPHKLSQAATILVPSTIAEEARRYLATFQGRIVSFNSEQSIRPHVIEVLTTYYSNVWHICNEDGTLIGSRALPTRMGFSEKTYLKTDKGEILFLMEGEGKPVSKAMRGFQKMGRFIGLHYNSPTHQLETDHYFRRLRIIVNDPMRARNCAPLENCYFAGDIDINSPLNIEILRRLGILKALKFYEDSHRLEMRTGIHNIADYYMKQAIYGDLITIFYKEHLAEEFNFSLFDLKMIADVCEKRIFSLLEKLNDQLKNHNSVLKVFLRHIFGYFIETRQEVLAEHFFKKYYQLLREALINLQRAKESVEEILSVPYTGVCSTQSNLMQIGQEEWAKVPLPEDTVFDLGKNAPHSDALNAYARKIWQSLPRKDIEKMVELYKQVYPSPLSDEANRRKEEYRCNVIRSVIRWTLQEQKYAESLT